MMCKNEKKKENKIRISNSYGDKETMINRLCSSPAPPSEVFLGTIQIRGNLNHELIGETFVISC